MTFKIEDLTPAQMSRAERLATLLPAQRAELQNRMTQPQREALKWEWDFWARPDQIVPDDCSIYVRSAGRGSGKLLDLDTPIPTPYGWRSLRWMALGDELFDERGQICRITAVFDALPERAWKLDFSDSTSIIAGGEHQWTTWTHYERKAYCRSAYESDNRLPVDWPTWRSKQSTRGYKPLPPRALEALALLDAGWTHQRTADHFGVSKSIIGMWARRRRLAVPSVARETAKSLGPRVRTTDEIVRTLHYGGRGDLNHSIPVAYPLEMPEVVLPIDPYVFGYWLGDGSSANSDITVSDEDAPETLGRFIAAGYGVGRPRPSHHGAACATYPIGKVARQIDPKTGRLGINYGLHSTLNAFHILRDKHVPEMFLWADAPQRLALLQGLMDSDGCVAGAQVEFTSTNERLADAVVFLARSLGAKPVKGKGRATLYGVDHGPKWRVLWRPNFHNPFLLRRKANAVKPLGAQASRSFHRMIEAATPVPVRPMRCLTVDSPNSLFLAGEGMIPTHNTREGAEWARKKGPQHREGLLIGANPRDARDLMLEGRSGIVSITPPWERPVYEPTKLLLRWPNGAIAHVRSAEDPAGIRGLSVEWLWADEIVKWRFLQQTWDQARLALREGRHPQTVVTTTPMPLPLIKKLLKGGRGILVRPPVSTYRNFANLSPDYLRELLEMYEGTRLGDQELHAMVLEDIKGAIWTHAEIEGARWGGEFIETPTGLFVPALSLRRRVVGVDPSGSTLGDEWGIVVVGTDGRRPPCGFVLDDRSLRGSPEECAREAVHAYWEHGCEALVVEVNYGGEMVERVVRAVPAEGGFPSGETVRVEVVRAGRGQSKYERAVPVHSLFEQNLRGFRRFYMVGVFKELEGQMTTWIPPEQADDIEVFKSKWSPDRMDAMVWASLYLLVLNPRVQGRSEGEVLRSASIA